VNAKLNITDWQTKLGLFPMPLFQDKFSKEKFVLLNGGIRGNLCIDFKEEDINQARSYAWSSDVGQYLILNNEFITVYRWDTYNTNKYRVSEVAAKLNSFYDYLKKEEISKQDSVVKFSLQLYRQIRSLLRDNQGNESLNTLFYLFACTADNSDREKLKLALTAEYKEFELDESRLQYIDKAFKLFTEAGNRQGVARCYISYANNYPGIRKTEKAIEYYQQAADIFRELHDKRGEGNSLINIGYQKCLKGEFESGISLVNEGVSLRENSGSAVFVTNGYFLLGICKRLQGKYDECTALFQRVEDITLETKASFNMATLYEEWALALEASGDAKGALEMYKRYYRDMENMYKFDKNSAVSDARMTFELEEKKREAEILKNILYFCTVIN